MRNKEITYSEYSPIKCIKSINDLTNQKFGRLTAIKPIGIKHRYVYWECKCDCGKSVSIRGSHLISGQTISCGCAIHAPNKTHGQSRTRLGAEYHGIMQRCYNKRHTNYKNYGGRGVMMCEEWLNDRTKFFDWALSHGYSDDLTIDRINPCGNYEPGNCRWISNIEQQNNRRNNKILIYNGESHTQAEWARKVGITPNSLALRLYSGWSLERALTTPQKTNGR